MRSCIYCGRELADGEKCNCPQAAARRAGENQSGTTSNASNDKSGAYRTGYTKKVNPINRAWEKRKTKTKARRGDGIGSDIYQSIIKTIKNPVDSVSNPRMISNGAIMLLSMIQGAIIWLCIYFLRTGAVRSPFGMALSIITLNLTKADTFIYMLLSLISGAVGGLLFMFIYVWIFVLVNRAVFRQRSGFWNLAQRLVLTPIPMTLICVIGCLFGLISSTTLAIMVICGVVSMIALTYEALKAEWISRSSDKIMYAMMLGFFIVIFIMCYIIRIS